MFLVIQPTLYFLGNVLNSTSTESPIASSLVQSGTRRFFSTSQGSEKLSDE